MKVLHFVTDQYAPSPGGLETRTRSVAERLSDLGYKVFIHILSAEHGYDFYNKGINNVTLYLPYFENQIIDESIRKSPMSDKFRTGEYFRTRFLCIKNQIQKELNRYPDSLHIVISNFLTNSGYISHLVAEALGLPHVASVVGTDFSRGLTNPVERFTIKEVLANAEAVITLNQQFETTAKRITKKDNVFTIHNSSSLTEPERWSKPKNRARLVLFSDCGYCHKKGSQILFESFRRLRLDGFDIMLRICGATNSEQLDFWNAKRTAYSLELGDCFIAMDYLEKTAVNTMILSSDIYCSATLGEGCSNARINALLLGIPMVTTNCGEISDIAADIAHVRVSEPGDVEGFYFKLRQAVIDTLENKINPEAKSIDRLKVYLSPSREIGQWVDVLNMTAKNN